MRFYQWQTYDHLENDFGSGVYIQVCFLKWEIFLLFCLTLDRNDEIFNSMDKYVFITDLHKISAAFNR